MNHMARPQPTEREARVEKLSRLSAETLQYEATRRVSSTMWSPKEAREEARIFEDALQRKREREAMIPLDEFQHSIQGQAFDHVRNAENAIDHLYIMSLDPTKRPAVRQYFDDLREVRNRLDRMIGVIGRPQLVAAE